MDDWDPSRAPPRERWLAMDEQDRIQLVLAAHRRLAEESARSPQGAGDILHAAVTNTIPHAALHAILETQIALDDPPAVRATLERLEREGLKRHAALHGMGVVLTQTLSRTMELGRFDAEAYSAGISAITPDFVLDGLVRALSDDDDDDDDAPPEPSRNRAERRAAARKRRR